MLLKMISSFIREIFSPQPMLRSGIYLFKNGLEVTIVINGDPMTNVVSDPYTTVWTHSQHN